MDAEQLDRWIERAQAALDYGDTDRALETLRQVLAVDPDHAVAHAHLSMVLSRLRRVHAALYEAEIAVGLAPEAPSTHAALGVALMGHRRLAEARRALMTVVELAPESAVGYLMLSNLNALEGRRDDRLDMLRKAAERDPDHPDIQTALGDHWLSVGDLDAAERAAHDALAANPGLVDALVLKGAVLLQRGDTAGAREHALWALSSDATDTEAIGLLASVKARSSLLLGAWWRWNSRMLSLGRSRSIALVLVAFVAVRISTLYATDVGALGTSLVLQLMWLLLCVYSWTAPWIFSRMLSAELKTVSLRSDF